MKAKVQSKTGHKIITLNRRRAIRENCLNCSCWSPKDVSKLKNVRELGIDVLNGLISS